MKNPKLKQTSITVMIPAYNEEKYLAETVNMACRILNDLFEDYEILIFDDCSVDRTPQIADSLVKKNSNIRVIHNKTNKGVGYNFRKGIKLSNKDYYCYLIADLDTPEESIRNVLMNVGKSDFVTTYIKDDDRPLYRRVISRGFTITLNLLFRHHLKYYCGAIVVYKTKLLKKLNLRTDSFAMNAEAILHLLHQKKSYVELSYPLTSAGRVAESNVTRLKNIRGVLKIIGTLFFEDFFSKNKK